MAKKEENLFDDVKQEPPSEDILTKLSDAATRLRNLDKDYKKDKDTLNKRVAYITESLDKWAEKIDFVLDIQTIEAVLKEYALRRQNISRVEIPTLMRSVKLEEIKLMSGEKISLEDKIKASITEANKKTVYLNMIESEFENNPVLQEALTNEVMTEEEAREKAKENVDEFYKEVLTIKDPTKEQKDQLILDGFVYEDKKSIHSATLNKYCRELVAKGLKIPTGISAFEYTETKIK
jgi:hypothetical protein